MTKCPICNSIPHYPINLKCNHHPCYQCALTLLTPDSHSKLQQKYHLNCPVCHVKTVTYNLKHLIINQQQSDQFLVTDKYLANHANIGQSQHEKTINQDKIHLNEKSNQNEKSHEHNKNPMSKRGSITCISSAKTTSQIICPQHNQPLKYFCQECSQTNLPCILCPQCARPHYNKQHRLISLRQAEPKLLEMNIQHKKSISIKKGQINSIKTDLMQKQRSLQDHYKNLGGQLQKQYSKVISRINQVYQKLDNNLKEQKKKALQQYSANLKQMQLFEQQISTISSLELKDFENNVKFNQKYRIFDRPIAQSNSPILPVLSFPQMPQWVHINLQQSSHLPLTLTLSNQYKPNHRKNKSSYSGRTVKGEVLYDGDENIGLSFRVQRQNSMKQRQNRVSDEKRCEKVAWI